MEFKVCDEVVFQQNEGDENWTEGAIALIHYSLKLDSNVVYIALSQGKGGIVQDIPLGRVKHVTKRLNIIIFFPKSGNYQYLPVMRITLSQYCGLTPVFI